MNGIVVRYKCLEAELERSDTRVGMLLCLLNESHVENAELEKRCSMVDVVNIVQSIMKSRSRNSKGSNCVYKIEMPSFSTKR